jgi:hypothetical protein
MTNPCLICKKQLTKQLPTETITCCAVTMFGRDSRGEESVPEVKHMPMASPPRRLCLLTAKSTLSNPYPALP